MTSGAMANGKKPFHAIPRFTTNWRRRFCDMSKEALKSMRLHGRVYKDGTFWLAEVPMLDAMTQGHTRKAALAMVADLLETLANRSGFVVQVYPGKHEEFEVSAADTRGLISLLLRRQRERSGLSLAEAATRLGWGRSCAILLSGAGEAQRSVAEDKAALDSVHLSVYSQAHEATRPGESPPPIGLVLPAPRREA